MKKYILALALGSTIILAVPAFATTSPYVFGFTGCTTGNTACGDGLSAYGPVTSTGTSTNVTATAIGVYYTVGTSTGYTAGAPLTAGLLGAYSGAGLGACESMVSPNCTSPNHQIDNGPNTSDGSGNNDYEFILIKFSSAIDLSSIQLGNFGGGGSDPFHITYYTSADSTLSAALAGTSLGSTAFTTTDGFSGPQSESGQSGTCGTNGVCTDTTATNDVQYLLIGASISDDNSDYFKIQAINGTTYNNSSPTPEPATFGLIGLALAGLGAYSRKRRPSRS